MNKIMWSNSTTLEIIQKTNRMRALILTISIALILSCTTSKKVVETQTHASEVQMQIDSLNLKNTNLSEVKSLDTFSSNFEIEWSETDSGAVEFQTPTGFIKAKKSKAGRVRLYGTTTNKVEQKEIQEAQFQKQEKIEKKQENHKTEMKSKEVKKRGNKILFIVLSLLGLVLVLVWVGNKFLKPFKLF